MRKENVTLCFILKNILIFTNPKNNEILSDRQLGRYGFPYKKHKNLTLWNKKFFWNLIFRWNTG